MIKDIQVTIGNLIHVVKEHEIDGTISFSNIYEYDLDFNFVINKRAKEVLIDYRGIKLCFDLPLNREPINTKSIKSLFIAKSFLESINTVKLEYLLSIHYTICLNEFIKNNCNYE